MVLIASGRRRARRPARVPRYPAPGARGAAAGAVHGARSDAFRADAVWFRSRDEARALLLAELAAGRAPFAWFWRLAVPDWSLAEVVQALMAMRGIDMVTATAFLAEIGDLSRFRTPRELMAYVGIVRARTPPATRSSVVRSPRPAIGGCDASARSRIKSRALWRSCDHTPA